ncbi:MAG: bifunctional pyr operon transcriptional regulator/uracil phosphoribosyltransferase PyrR [Candidatus Aureabacteria bacterium]|nr:bifunctional pyr operon transcriptional regulator/uracil phosphoribosyltransferase PyrR [Candidatus Auribacterota bacterium]MCK5161817.1 bifunctional pyr operon transcriptional regulator/uracil phosphoribosyltransferase PyrR [Candidatus Auribacterota bacterium]
MVSAVKIMDEGDISRAVTRMAHEIIEKNKTLRDVVVVGIRTRGVYLAKRLIDKLGKLEKIEIPFGVLDITFYRDDLDKIDEQPVVHSTEINLDLTDKVVIIADDVLYSGRTVRAALNALMDFGRPKKVELAVLIDRGHRELPIKADYVGKNIPTSRREKIKLRITEVDGKEDEVIVEK